MLRLRKVGCTYRQLHGDTTCVMYNKDYLFTVYFNCVEHIVMCAACSKTNALTCPELWKNVLWLCFNFIRISLWSTGIGQKYHFILLCKQLQSQKQASYCIGHFLTISVACFVCGCSCLWLGRYGAHCGYFEQGTAVARWIMWQPSPLVKVLSGVHMECGRER